LLEARAVAESAAGTAPVLEWSFMGESGVVVRAPELERFCAEILTAAGASAADARLVAASLVAANLRGVDSHGVQLLVYYVEQIEAGDLDVKARGEVLLESGSCLLYHGRNGLGQVVSDICTGHGIRLAMETGISLVVARESNHFGACAWWAQKYAAAGLIGIVMCNASPMVPPWQGREPRFGTNPLCVAVPGGAEPPWLLDMATTTVAAGKIYKAMHNGRTEIPHGWAMDRDGVPTTSVEAALKGLLMPLGGYKGSGLAFLGEILCGVLGGGAMSTELGGIRIRGRAMRCSQMFLGIDVARFLPLHEFQARMDRLIRTVKSAQPASGYDEVLVANEPELREEERRRRGGIPLEAGSWERLAAAAARLGVRPPL
jgi:LDH2 family malate/lactate/ureidoglycolate dehydrogenase